MSRRVVVTGIGAVSPCGNTAAETWESMVEARSGVGPISRFDCQDWPVRIAAEVKGFDAEALLGRRVARRMGEFTRYAAVASDEAVADAGLDWDREDPDRVGTYIGSGIGGIGEIVDSANAFRDQGYKGLSPFFIPIVLANMSNGVLAMRYNARGPSLCTAGACATGNNALGEAWRAIRAGDAEVLIAGGSEASAIEIAIGGFMVMKALSKNNDDAARASKPFDARRDGFVVGEGAAVLVLEEYEHARARGARIYAELTGYGLSNDAFHMTAPGNEGAARCMRAALKSARLDPAAVGYVNAHGTATAANDVNETRAIHTVFGERALKLPVSSTKGVTGHMLGAAGGVEAIACVKAIHTGVIPPTAHWEVRDPECDLDYVPGGAREVAVTAALSNSFGFGGTNASLVFQSV
jgi:3-oxoacyl-[acyl-carrier-protein] synthase II